MHRACSIVHGHAQYISHCMARHVRHFYSGAFCATNTSSMLVLNIISWPWKRHHAVLSAGCTSSSPSSSDSNREAILCAAMLPCTCMGFGCSSVLRVAPAIAHSPPFIRTAGLFISQLLTDVWAHFLNIGHCFRTCTRTWLDVEVHIAGCLLQVHKLKEAAHPCLRSRVISMQV